MHFLIAGVWINKARRLRIIGIEVLITGCRKVNDGRILFSNTAGLNLFQVKDLENLIGKPINKYLDVNELQLASKQKEYAQAGENTVNPLEKRI